MEVAVISVETIKAPLAARNLKPYRLSLLEQVTPPTYTPFVFFYPTNDPHLNSTSHISSQLKWSLSKTLTPFYPLFGRVKDNLVIDNYQEGVPFIEARVKGCLLDFLENPQLELLNKFLPRQPFCLQANPSSPQVVTQLNVFDCGGIALCLCILHKITDGITVKSFLNSWAAISSGCYDKVIHPKLHEASVLFPPLEPLPPYYTSLVNNLFFTTGKRHSTRRFVFSAEAVETLRANSRSEVAENPTRVEALSAFIWKSTMLASKSLSGSFRPSILVQSVNVRGRTRPRMSRYCFGNLVRSGMAYCMNMADNHGTPGMDRLVAIVRDGIDKINGEYLKTLCGEKGNTAILEHLNRIEENSKADPDVFTFSSWHKFGINDIDFGWGKPIWVGVFGKASLDHPSDSNFTVLKDIGASNSIEAWVTLDERLMAVLENDPQFLSYVSLNPSILNLVAA